MVVTVTTSLTFAVKVLLRITVKFAESTLTTVVFAGIPVPLTTKFACMFNIESTVMVLLPEVPTAVGVAYTTSGLVHAVSPKLFQALVTIKIVDLPFNCPVIPAY